MNFLLILIASVVSAQVWQQYTDCSNVYSKDTYSSWFVGRDTTDSYAINTQPATFQQTKEECLAYVEDYIAYWNYWGKRHCVVYEEVPDSGAKCYIYDQRGTAADGWPEEPRTCQLYNDGIQAENFYTIVVTKESSGGNLIQEKTLANC